MILRLIMFQVIFLVTVGSSLVSLNTSQKQLVEKVEKRKVAVKQSYKQNEKIEKAPSEDHPCKLTRTSLKISFPALKNELFVNILGYREPNLVKIMKCKGVCGDARGRVACEATRVEQKKILMMFKTNSSGQGAKKMVKELILDEHVECGCRCSKLSQAQCAGRFDELTCECACSERRSRREKMMCESRPDSYWDYSDCKCVTKGVAPREIGCSEEKDSHKISYNSFKFGFPVSLSVNMFLYVCMGCCMFLAGFQTASTWYYRKQVKHMENQTKLQTTLQKKCSHNEIETGNSNSKSNPYSKELFSRNRRLDDKNAFPC